MLADIYYRCVEDVSDLRWKCAHVIVGDNPDFRLCRFLEEKWIRHVFCCHDQIIFRDGEHITLTAEDGGTWQGRRVYLFRYAPLAREFGRRELTRRVLELLEELNSGDLMAAVSLMVEAAGSKDRLWKGMPATWLKEVAEAVVSEVSSGDLEDLIRVLEDPAAPLALAA